MDYTLDNREKLLSLKPGEDTVWAAVKTPVFRTHDGYFGHYMHGDPDDPWTTDCIRGESPVVFKPTEMTYTGRFEMPGDGMSYLFVFSDKYGESLPHHGRVMPWYYAGADPFAVRKTLSAGAFCAMLSEENRIDCDKTFFDRDECAVKCRSLNQNYCVSDAVGSLGKWYEKTLDDMRRQLDECLCADWVVDPVEKLKDAVKGEDD